MRQLLIFSTILSFAIITGCGTKSDQNAVDSGTVNAPVEVNKLSPNPSPAVNSSQTITAPIISTPQNTTVQSSVATNSAGLNPAHGQPGHKCEIPVGAPLNSAPLNSAPTTAKPVNQNQVITTSAPTVTSTASTTPVKVAAGMNPSHGQPGHRCDIAVGAPLNSTPAASNTTTTTTTTPTVNSNVTPGSISPTTINTTPTISTPTTTTTTAASTPVKVAKGMNPSHGQPGHRCDIAVGAPLNSPSNTTTPVTATPEPKKQ